MRRALPDHVGVDGFNLALAQGTGVATYARTLAQALQLMGRKVDLVYGLDVPAHAAPPARETLFFHALAQGRSGGEAPERVTWRGALRRAALGPQPRDLVEVPVRGRVVLAGMAERMPAFDRLFTLNRLFYVAARHFRRYGRFLRVRMAAPPAVMHWTYPLPVRLLGARNIYTIHDLVPLRLPYLSLEDKAYHEAMLRRLVATADHVVTVSDTSRADILACLDAAPERVTSCAQALPDDGGMPASGWEARLAALFGLAPGGYFLFHGAVEPKKNVARLLEAFLAAAPSRPLVIAGPAAWGAEGELRLLADAPAGRVRRLGWLPPQQLDLLIRGARALLFPSLYEGFGLPALEAMARGVPVLAGGGALPEVAGDGALAIDPFDVHSIGNGIARLDRDDALCARLATAGRARAQDFSLARYAGRLAALHATLMDGDAT